MFSIGVIIAYKFSIERIPDWIVIAFTKPIKNTVVQNPRFNTADSEARQ
jgi:hypothetical protein